ACTPSSSLLHTLSRSLSLSPLLLSPSLLFSLLSSLLLSPLLPPLLSLSLLSSPSSPLSFSPLLSLSPSLLFSLMRSRGGAGPEGGSVLRGLQLLGHRAVDQRRP